MADGRKKKDMKILQITNKVPVPPKDGGSIASLRLSEELAKQGNQVWILAMNTSKHYVDHKTIDSFQNPNMKIIPVNVDTRIRPLKAIMNLLFSKMPYNAVRFISSEFRNKLTTLLKEKNPDLVILENLYPAAYIQDIRNSTSSPIAYRAHNVEFEIWERTANNAGGIKKWYLKVLTKRIHRFEKNLINKYDFLVPITKRDEDALERMGNKKPSYVLPTGYAMKRTSCPELNLDKPIIAHLGALDWLPNQEGILWFIDEVWPNLKKEIPDIEFHLAGRNAPEWFEKRLAGKEIEYHGEIDDAEKFILSYPIHVVPLFSGSGMRIKIVEAMAHGRVVVTTNIGTEGIDTQHIKNIIIADTPAAFSNAIIDIISNEAFCREIGENAFNFVANKLNNEKLVSGFLEFLNKNI